MRKQIGRKLMAGILAAVIMITSVPKTVYAVEQAGRTEQENSAWMEDGVNADEKFDSEEKIGSETSDKKNDDEDESKAAAPDDEIEKDDVNGTEMPDHDNVSGEENESEAAGEKDDSEETDAEVSADSPDNTEADDTAGEEDLEAEDDLIEEEDEINYIATYAMTTQNDAVNWIKAQIGNTIGSGECVDLTKAYFEYMGFSSDDFKGNATAYANMNPPSGWQKILRAKPIQAGDVVIWSGGHVALAISDSTLVEQNYLGVRKCEDHPMVKPGYDRYALSDYWGVWRPNFNSPVIDRVKGSYMDTGYAQTIPDGYYHIASSFGDIWWLTIAGMSNDDGANVNLYDYSIRNFECDEQLFYFQFIDEGGGRGFYKITNKKSGKCLDVENASEYMFKENGKDPTNVQQWSDNGSPAQQWAVKEIDGGDKGVMYTLQARCSSFFLDLYLGEASLYNGANISMHRDDGNGNLKNLAQQRRLVPYAPAVGKTISDGEYQIAPFLAENKVVSASGMNPGNGANIELNSYKGDYRHTFDVKYLGNGYYSMINKYSGASLDVANSSRVYGANVQLCTYSGKDAQQWIVKPCGDGYYRIISKCSGLYLDLAYAITEDGANIWTATWVSKDNHAQKWKFIPYVQPKLDPPTSDIPSGTEVEAGARISLSCGEDGAMIYYTLDGTVPTRQSTLYTAPIAVTVNVTVKALAVKEGYQDSDVAVYTYTVKSDNPDTPDNPDNPDDPDKPDRPGDEVPKEDIPENNVIPDGLWVAGLAEGGYDYTGKAIKPEMRVYDHKTLLKEKTDYTISYKNNTNVYGYEASNSAFDAGKAPTITVTARGNYSGKETLTFRILPLDIGSPSFAADDMTVACKNGVQKPVPTLFWQNKKLKNNTDFTVAYYSGGNRVDSVKEAGRYDMEITGKGNFSGTRRIGLTVTKDLKLMSKMSVAGIKGQVYTGDAITPALTVKDGRTKLTEGEHYTVSYSQNTAVDTAYAVVTGREEAGYSGTKRVSFKILGTPISKAVVEGLSGQKFVYDGVDITPQLNLRIGTNTQGASKPLTPGTDYTVTWQKNRNAGTAAVIFTGKGAYTGTLKKTFKIGGFDIAANADGRFTLEVEQAAVPYAKGGAKPKVTAKFKKGDGSWQTLTEGQDYALSYQNNTAVNDGGRTDRQPTVMVKGKGNFSGTFSNALRYKITAQDIGELTMTAADKTYQNKKNSYATKITVTDRNGRVLKAGTDYDRTFTYVYKSETTVKNGTAADSGTTVRAAGDSVGPGDIIPAGTILRVTVTAKDGGNYTGMLDGEYRITQVAISSASVSIPKQTYTGRAITLDESQLTVKIKGKPVDQDQYRIVPGSYKNNVKKGTASVTLRGVGNYGGTKAVKFTIKAKGFVWWK